MEASSMTCRAMERLEASPVAHGGLGAAFWVYPLAVPREGSRYFQYSQEFAVEEALASIRLNIAVDGYYAAWVDDHFLGSGPYPAWPDQAHVDTWPLPEGLSVGSHILRISQWCPGKDTAAYCRGREGLAFSLSDSAGIFCLSKAGGGLSWRLDPGYRLDRVLPISPQLGDGFCYDAQNAEAAGESLWQPVEEGDTESFDSLERRFSPRPVTAPELGGRVPVTVSGQGWFDSPPGDEAFRLNPVDYRLEDAPACDIFEEPFGTDVVAFPLVLRAQPERPGKGVYLRLDLGEEQRGYWEIELTTDTPALIQLSWGEHLADGRVRSRIGERNFCAAYRCRTGSQVFRQPFRRMGCRFIEIYLSDFGASLTLQYCGLRRSAFTVERTGFWDVPDDRMAKIIDVCDHTLRCCMGDTYEDTPWREQALYALDALNQSLAGYYLYGNYPYAEASFELLGGGLREEGYLELTAPSRLPVTIPAFTYIWIVGVERVVRYGGNLDWGRRIFPWLCQILYSAGERMQDGLLPSPKGAAYWHFYDWSAGGLDGCEGADALTFKCLNELRFDAILNAHFALALEAAVGLAGALGCLDAAEKWQLMLTEVRSQMQSAFWDSERGVVKSSVPDPNERAVEETPSELVQALALLAGAVPALEADALRERLARKETGWIPASLSQMLWIGDAIAANPDHRDLLKERICAEWIPMLRSGNRTFWETREGEAAFAGAGSLCHGWSAIPAYLLGRYRF